MEGVLLMMIAATMFVGMGCSNGEEIKHNDERDVIREQVDNMTLREKIGQMIVVGFDGETVNEEVRNMIEQYHVSGVVLFGRNISSAQQTTDLLNELKRTNMKNSVPLILSLDEEGGRVSRVPKDIVKLPASLTIAKKNDVELAHTVGVLLAKEVKQMGFNLDYTPVLDINSNPNNPVIGDRSFGADKEIVTKMGISTMKGLQSQGVIPVVKHFPGHGDTAVDSHLGLPVIEYGMDRLNDFELVPFEESIEQGADMVMVAHILFPEIDKEYPSSMSEKVIKGILREQLKFDGVVITDDMEMGAIADNYGIEKAALQSVKAGNDLLLICHDYNKQIAAFTAIEKAVENNTIDINQINDSVYRILKLKHKYNLKDDIINQVDVEKINKEVQKVLSEELNIK